jgi:rhamnosyltransferase
MNSGTEKYDRLLVTVPAFLLGVLIISFPMVIELLKIKGLLFLFLIFVIVVKLLKTGKLYLHDQVLFIGLFQIAVSLFFLALGAIKGAPGVAKQAQVYAFWPLIYLLLITELSDREMFRKLRNMLLIAAAIAIAVGFDHILSQLGIIAPLITQHFTSEETTYGVQEGYIKLEFIGLNSFAFLIPFLFALLVAPGPEKGSRSYRCFLLTALLAGAALVVLSGRRAVLLVTMLAPLIVLVLKGYQDRSSLFPHLVRTVKLAGVTALAMVLLLGAAGNIVDINLAGIYDFFVSGFDFSAAAGHSEYLRREQFHALISGWLSSPLLGSGLGSYTNASIRSADMPWSYELHYLSLLYQTGVVGFVSYCVGIGWLYRTGLKIIARNDDFSGLLIPYLTGLTCFLVASATNPYLPSFEGIWVIFLTVAAVNFSLLETKAATVPSAHESGHAPESTVPRSAPPDITAAAGGQDQVCAVIVCHNGAPTVAQTVRALKNRVGRIVIIDNASDAATLSVLQAAAADGIPVIFNDSNLGVAHALNQGIEYAEQHGFPWLLTMDQDSIADEHMVAGLLGCAAGFSGDSRYGSFSPLFIDDKHTEESYGPADRSFSERYTVITSGNLVKTELFREVGRFEEKLFIDGVDLEFCLRLRKRGYRIVRCHNARLFHSLGQVVPYRLFGISLLTTQHAPLRKYYIVRNYLFILNRYLTSYPLYCMRKLFNILNLIMQILLLEPDKSASLGYLAKGLRDGIGGRWGAFMPDQGNGQPPGAAS